MRIVDLSFPIRPHFRWKVEPKLVRSHAAGDVFQSTVLTVACHAYTHVDAPVHFLPGDRDIAAMPVDQWIGEAAVVDLTHLGDNGEVTAAELDAHAGHVRRGDIALLRTDWPRKVSVESEKFWRDAPYTGRSACDWLVSRGVKAVGYDYPPDYTVRTSIFEPGVKLTPAECTTHHVFFPAGITVIEYLTNLDQIGADRCRFLALPLRIEGADGSPVRAVAVEVGQVLDDSDTRGEEHVVRRALGRRQLDARLEDRRAHGVVGRIVVADGLHAAAHEPITRRAARVWCIPPELLALHADLARPVGAQQRDIAATHVTGVRVQLGRRHLAVVPEVREVHHRGLPDPLVDRHGGDVAVAGQEVDRRIDVRVGVAGDGEHRGLEDVPGGMRSDQLGLDLPAEVRADGKGQVDDAHGPSLYTTIRRYATTAGRSSFAESTQRPM